MKRRSFLQITTAAGLSLVGRGAAAAAPISKGKAPGDSQAARFELNELTISAMQAGMASGQFSATGLTRRYLERIERIDQQGPSLHSVLELNPDALDLARELDRERKAKRVRGPLHGVPVFIKDNIATHDRMTCTAGSLALLGSHPLQDAFLVRKLRDAGAIILGKTNLSEWANFRGSRSISGWSGRWGFTRNPYVLDRNPSGSSSGSAVGVAANLCAVAVGTETNGSIVSPASYNGIVGLKPTVGLVSRSGIIPIARSQDTAGPMARTVTDAAILLSCLAGIDPQDEGGSAGIVRPPAQSGSSQTMDYTTGLTPDGLRGARLGVARKVFHKHPLGAKTLEERTLEELKRAGALLIDPIELPGELPEAFYDVMLYEFKAGLNAYLEGLGPQAPIRSLKELIDFNERNRDAELFWFGQEHLIRAQEKGPLTESRYLEAVAACRRSTREEGLDAIMDKHQLDAIVAPTAGPAHVTDAIYGDRDTGGSSTPAAVAGYPNITVPAGFVSGLPVGVSFFGRAWSEPVLLKLAYAFECQTSHRRPPEFKASVA